tara:strand:- start:1221 stop:2189 length:969 start_codon:yes stop_codon:yes gene_type:complete
MEKNKRRSIAIFWDYENARPVAETSIVGLSGRIRDLLIPHGDIVSRKVYYDSQSPSELKTNRTDLDMTGWTLVDCPKRQKKETLDKKIIVDLMFFIAYENPHNACVCLISGDGDFCYVMNRVRDLGVHTILLYPDKITYYPLITNVHEAHSWEKEIIKKEKLNKKKITEKISEKLSEKLNNERKTPTDSENDDANDDNIIEDNTSEHDSSSSETNSHISNDEPDEIALYIYLTSVRDALNRGKDPDKALDALIAEIWYKQMNSENGTVQQETKDWYKSIRKKAKELDYITVTENRDTPGHITRYASLTNTGLSALRERTSSF